MLFRSQSASDQPAIDLSSFQLPVVGPTADEAAAHAKMLEDVDKASGGKTLWRTLETVL